MRVLTLKWQRPAEERVVSKLLRYIDTLRPTCAVCDTNETIDCVFGREQYGPMVFRYQPLSITDTGTRLTHLKGCTP